jgi:hypothetical protein
MATWNCKAIPGQLFEIADAKGDPVMRIRGGMFPTPRDAHLMTAAPDLLDVLERARYWLENQGWPCGHELGHDIGAVIARAKGEA